MEWPLLFWVCRVNTCIPVSNDWFITIVSGFSRVGNKYFSNFIDIPSCPDEFFICRNERTFVASFSSMSKAFYMNWFKLSTFSIVVLFFCGCVSKVVFTQLLYIDPETAVFMFPLLLCSLWIFLAIKIKAMFILLDKSNMFVVHLEKPTVSMSCTRRVAQIAPGDTHRNPSFIQNAEMVTSENTLLRKTETTISDSDIHFNNLLMMDDIFTVFMVCKTHQNNKTTSCQTFSNVLSIADVN